jgi:drug/metabolite transporter (DMT)-like permease
MGLGILRCAIAAAMFGATTPLAARIADDTSAPVLAGLLYLGAAVAVLPIVGRRRLDPAAVRRGAGRLGMAVVAGGFLGPLLLAAGLSRTPGATASLLLNLELVATTILAAVVFREHLGRRVVVGTVLVVGAGVLLAWSGTPELRVGALLVVGACICWGLDNCVTAELDEIAPEHITLAKGLIAGGTNLVLGLAIGGALPPVADLGVALVIGALGYGASITLWVAGARDLGAARGQLVFSSAPFLGVLVAWGVLGDDVRGVELAALVLAGAGVLRVLRSDHEHPHDHRRLEHEHEHVHDDDHHGHEHEEAGSAIDAVRRHTHRHAHEPVVHAHPHVPDLHHRHEHSGA